MGDVIQFKKKEGKKEDARTSKVYADYEDCWQDMASEEKYKAIFHDPLRPWEKLIFRMGVIAGQREERGLWTVPEDFTFNS